MHQFEANNLCVSFFMEEKYTKKQIISAICSAMKFENIDIGETALQVEINKDHDLVKDIISRLK